MMVNNSSNKALSIVKILPLVRHLGLLFVVVVISACDQGKPPELIIHGGTLLTMDPATEGASAFAISHGNITHVGSDDEILLLAGDNTKLVNLAGQTAIPAFNDAHAHSMGLPPGSVALENVKELSVLGELLRVAAVNKDEGEWVVGHGYDDTNFGGHLTRIQLDSFGIERPILLIHNSLHLFLANSLALENANITATTPDPEGGFIRRDPDDEPTGLLGEMAAQSLLFVPAQPSPYPHDLSGALAGIDSFLQTALENGITSYGEALVPPKLALLFWWTDPSSYGVRVNLMLDGGSLDAAFALKHFDEIASLIGWRPFSNPWLRARTIKIFHGMSLSGRTARLHEPYADRPDYRGEEPQRSQAELNQLVEAVHDAGFQAAIHANGDYEIDMVLDAYARLINDAGTAARHRIEHGSIVSARIMQRMSDLKVVLAPHSYIFEKGPMLEAYGEQRWPWMFANASTFDYGVVNAANSDFPVSELSPLRRIQSLVTRTSREGKIYGPEQRLSVEQALYAYTMGGAYASFEEDVKGSITPGKYADFVILSADPRKVPQQNIHKIEVLATYSDGKLRYSKYEGR